MIADAMLAVPPRRALPLPAFALIVHPGRAPETKSADAPPLSPCFEVGRAALMALDRHYSPPARSARKTHAWGADGYRPEMPDR